MARGHISKDQRHQKLGEYIGTNPFVTDEELAKIFTVSLPTIRLDRIELGIPEVRERLKNVAEQSYSKVKSISGGELVGELIDLELGSYGLSTLMATEEMVFQKTKIARGHHLFAQANSLAVALVDSEVALTGASLVVFKRPVYLGEKIIAKAQMIEANGPKHKIKVVSRVGEEVVFRGKFMVFAVDAKGGPK